MVPFRARGGHKGQSRDRQPSQGRPKNLKRKRDDDDLEALSEQVTGFERNPAIQPTKFTELPLSLPTQNGLKDSKFTTLTSIQASAIPAALHTLDLLAAAKTGSGKTLAFLVPVLENLYRARWTEYDGLGTLILSPTRELAIQIFDVLRKVGRHHKFSAGLVIGGKSLQEERERLARMNILVATPGRMLQHMDQTAEFEVGNCKMLVLDEADRIMDMGFSAVVDAIIQHLPRQRQTLMFSATQTRRADDLKRLSVKEPEFVSVDAAADSATPSRLQQNYVLTPLPEKLDTLWSFIRTNLKKKTLVFLSSGKQVRFVYEAFRHLQPGVPLLHIHGRQKQTARLDITTRFSNSQYACLFATDVAARGLDFPAVDWVVQLDAPEDAETYIHRVGRTARYEQEGQAVMFLDPSEEIGMLKSLEKKKVTLEKINVREKKMQNSIKSQLQNMCFQDPELKYLGQKAFASYVRSVHIVKKRFENDTFKVQDLDLEGYAASMGLPGAPRVKFVKGEDTKKRKNAPRQSAVMSDGEVEEGAKPDKPVVRTKYDRMFERRNQDVLADHYARMIDDRDESKANGDTNDADEDDEFLTVGRRFDAGDEALGASASSSEQDDKDEKLNGRDTNGTSKPSNNTSKKSIRLSTNTDEALLIDSKRREKLLKSRKKLLKFKGHGSHMHFDDNDVPHEAEYYEREEEFRKKGAAEEQRRVFLEEERKRAEGVDAVDKAASKAKRREKKEKRKAREIEEAGEVDGGERVATLVPFDGEEPEVPAQPAKRQKKWFEDASSGDEQAQGKRGAKKKGRHVEEETDGPETIEDLEAVASGLLAH